MNSQKLFLLLPALLLALILPACITKRTVKDSSGNTIYSDTIIKRPNQSEEKTRQQVFDKEVELGVY